MSDATETGVPPYLPILRRGKVRDLYEVGEHLLIVASDRVSAFDVVLPTTVPEKGKILTGLSRFWFERTAHLVPNHLLPPGEEWSAPALGSVAQDLRARAMVVQRAARIDVECVARGYLAGSAWQEYVERSTIGLEAAPPGLERGERLATPRFTPAWKRDDGHDEAISRAELRRRVGPDLADRLEAITLALFAFASAETARRGLLLADTKFEFGFVGDELTLIDEALTPDSSRFWDAPAYRPGREPVAFDKQPLRDWLDRSGWNKQPPAPALPPEVVGATADRYAAAFQRITGTAVPAG